MCLSLRDGFDGSFQVRISKDLVKRLSGGDSEEITAMYRAMCAFVVEKLSPRLSNYLLAVNIAYGRI
jgi:hypothetical protein